MRKFIAKLLKLHPEPPFNVRLVASNTLTMEQWRKNENLVTAAIKLSRDNTFQMMLDVLRNDHPARRGFVPGGVSAEDRAAHQAKTEGYEACLNNIASLSQRWVISKPLISTFQTPTEKSHARNT